MKFSQLNLRSIGNTIQLTGAIYSGDGKSFLCFLPEDKNDLPLEVLEMNLDEWKTFLQQTDVMETEILKKASDGVIAKAIVRKSQRQVDQVVAWRVFKRDEFHCRYCANGDSPLTVDHIICWEDGGPTIDENLLSACKKCNRTRGNLPFEEWLKHPYYLRVSANLDYDTQKANLRVIETLPSIPRFVHVRSR